MVNGSAMSIAAALALAILAGCTSSPAARRPVTMAEAHDCHAVATAALRDRAVPVGTDGRPLLGLLVLEEGHDARGLDPVRSLKIEGLTRVVPGVTPERACALALDLRSNDLDARLTSKGSREIESAYLDTGTRRLNPAYRQAREALEDRQREEDLRPSGQRSDVLTGAWSGIVAGTTALFRPSEADLRERLQNTPRFLDEGDPTPYTLTIETIDARKSAPLDLALIDHRTGRASLLRTSVAEERKFEVTDDLHPGDQAVAAGKADYVERAVLDQWLQSPPLPSAEAMLAILEGDAGTAQTVEGGLDAVLVRWAPMGRPAVASSTLPSIAPPRPPGVVRISGMAGDGEGFYVTPDKVVTASHLVGDTSLVKITDATGFVAYGVVDRRDDGLGLAMIYLQRPGQAVPIAAAGTPVPGHLRQADAIAGRPLLAEGRVIGLVVDGEGRRMADAASLQSFAGLQARHLAATPP